jgi:hypothetical protein
MVTRFVLVAAFVVSAAVSAFAQVESSVNVLTQADRVRGTYTSISTTVPEDAVGDLSIRLNMPLGDYLDTRNRLVMTLYVLIDGVWTLGPSGEWEGGEDTGKDGTPNPPPTLSTNVHEPNGWDLRGKSVRVEVEVIRAQRMGATVITRRPQ